MNDQDILTCAAQAGEWLLDRRERLEKHEHESFTLLWLSVSEIETIIDNFDALEVVHGLTVDERVLRDDLIDWIGGERCRAKPVIPRAQADPPTDADALLSRAGSAAVWTQPRAVYRAIERGELRASRLCSRIRIRAADVEAWVDGNQIAPSNGAVRPSRPTSLRSREGLRRLLAES